MPTAAQFLATFKRAGFLVDVTWKPAAGGPPGTFKARWEAGSSEVLGGMVSAAEPVMTFETADVPLLTNGDTVSYGATDYRVRDVLPLYDGTITRALVRKQ